MAFLGLLACIGVLVGIFALNSRAGDSLARKKGIRCPECGSTEIRQQNGSSFKVNFGGSWKTMYEYKCKNCGHKFTRYE